MQRKKESLKYIVLNTHTYTDTLPHSPDQKSIILLKIQTNFHWQFRPAVRTQKCLLICCWDLQSSLVSPHIFL